MKVALVDYLNAVPLWWGLKARPCPEDWELCFSTPAGCAEMLRSGEARVGIIPSLEFVRIPDLCMPVPLGVACYGPVRSVLLFSGGPIEGVRKVLLDPSSRTSHGLVRMLFSSRVSAAPEYIAQEWDGGELPPDTAALRIGDRALRLGTEWSGEMLDLGAGWREQTGLPFVFAVWAARKMEEEAEVAKVLLESYLYGMERAGEIAALYAPRLGIAEADALDYLTVSLHYPLREPDFEGLREFWERASLEAETEDEG